ncbi:hypothetical protein F5X99DRAFT_408022 [Biscogniauxia marginata]|nr:hypothetical protein F5X99DRAFT_408022 [Biscogniauxia marginata]
MRAISFITALFVATTIALPLPAISTPGPLRDLPGTILDTVSDVLGYPLRPYGDNFRCHYNPGFCVRDCTAECIDGSETCGTCFRECYQNNRCFKHHRDGNDKDEDERRGTEDDNGASLDDGGI